MILEVTEEERLGLEKTFENFDREKDASSIFYDLCFCLCAPQTTFKNNRKVIGELIRLNFYEYGIKDDVLEDICKPARFYRNKARYLQEAKQKFPAILDWIKSYKAGHIAAVMVRGWLVRNVKGFGMKSASMFLREQGDKQFAIIDTHILKYMDCPPPKTVKEYEGMEAVFQDYAKANGLTPAELDALIWQRYSKTPWEQFKF